MPEIEENGRTIEDNIYLPVKCLYHPSPKAVTVTVYLAHYCANAVMWSALMCMEQEMIELVMVLMQMVMIHRPLVQPTNKLFKILWYFINFKM